MVHYNNLRPILLTFLDERILPHVNSSLIKWSLAGLVPQYLDNKQLLESLGLVHNDQIDLDKVREFLTNAFDKEPTLKIDVLGLKFTFTREDGEVLVHIMERYNA